VRTDEQHRVTASIRERKANLTFAVAHTPGGTVLLRSQDFRDSAAWESVQTGDLVSFFVGYNNQLNYVGRDIAIEQKFFAAPH
jgi:hypothetical protein